jgi:PAS domain S-box-containing protein
MAQDAITPAASRFEGYYRGIAVTIAVVLTAVFVYSSWDFASERGRREARLRFEFRASQIADAIAGRMTDYEQVLRGGAGLFAASERVDLPEWRAYVEHLRLGQVYPGIQALGHVPRVAAADRARHEARMRSGGHAQYAIWPEGDREEYAPIAFIEPLSGRNLRAVGFDMMSEPVRRATLGQARDSGEPALSEGVRLVQDQEAQDDAAAGVLMFMPVYRPGRDVTNAAQRRDALSGYIYGAFRMDDLMRGILGRLSDVRLEIFDGPPDRDAALLFDSEASAAAPRATPAFGADLDLRVRGRHWTLRVTSLPAFESTVDRETPRLVALVSALIGALVLGVIWSLATLRARALRLARAMTRDLRDSRERLALAIEGSNLVLFDWNVATGRVMLGERWMRITGRGAEALDTTITELQALVHPDDLAGVRREIEGLLAGRQAFYQVEHRVRTGSGDWRWISSRAKVVERDGFGRALRVTGTNVDVTERKEVERIKNEFVAVMNHELRTPLTALVGSLGLLKELAAGRLDAQAGAFLDMAQQNSERLSLLINDILDIERIESGGAHFRRDPVAIRPLLARAVALNTAYAERYGVRYEIAQPVPEVAVLADEDRLMQVLTNLMSNAAKFSPKGSAVTLSAALREGAVRVSVADRGRGVPEAFRERIFQKFAQADASDTRLKGGTGLGLFISRAIVEKMGGSIGYDSAPGQGATFYFDLPLHAAA